MKFIFTQNENKGLHLAKVQFGEDDIRDANLLHESVKIVDGSIAAVSYLFTYDEPGYGRGLVSVVLTAQSNANNPLNIANNFLSNTYNFLFDEGVRWNKNDVLKLDICGARAANMETQIKESINTWTEVDNLSQGTNQYSNELNIQTEVLSSNYPPFSDVNSNCIYVVDNYIISAKGADGEQGLMVGAADTYGADGELLSGMIMIFGDVIEQAYQIDLESPNSSSEHTNGITSSEILKNVVIHEVGHLLGLAHKCVSAEENCNTNSIMSYEYYDHGFTSLSSYDKSAINTLYE